MRAFAKSVKVKVERAAIASYWVAFFYSKLVGIIALRHRFMVIGRCHVAISAKITGWSGCRLGRNSVIGARTWINVNHRHQKECSVCIGENAFIGQDNFLTVGKVIKIGPYCLTGAYCSFISSTHLIDDPFVPYATTGTSGEDSILIGANCFFGYGAMVLGNVKIGHGVIVGAKSIVTRDIQPFSIAVGNPAKVIKHFDFFENKWVAGDRPVDKLCEIPSEDQYLRQLSSGRRFPLQPISAASAWLSDI